MGIALAVTVTLSTVVAAVGPEHGASVSTRAVRLERPARTFSVVAVGDWLSEFAVVNAAAPHAAPGERLDHTPLLAPIRRMITSVDLAICHMETPITAPGGAYGFVGRYEPIGYSLIAAPYEVASDLAAVGFDRCSTASNHSWDQGATGIATTLQALDAAGISHTGTARTPSEAAVDVLSVNDVRVGHVSLTNYSNTGYPPDPWMLDRATDAASVRRLIDAAHAAGAEVVVVSLHVFADIRSTPAPADRALVAGFTAPGDVDLVVIHGPHTIQPLEQVNGTPVFWSLGNLVSGMGVPGRKRFSDLRTLDGLAATARFTEQADGSFAVEVAPVLLCQMVDTRIVYHGLSTERTPAIEACIQRSLPVVPEAR